MIEPEANDRTDTPMQQWLIDQDKEAVTDAFLTAWAKDHGMNGRQIRRFLWLSKQQPTADLNDLMGQV